MECRFVLEVLDIHGGSDFDDSSKITVYHNVAPKALADSYTVTEDDPTILDVLANDTDLNEENELVIIDLAGADGPGANDAQIKSSGLGPKFTLIRPRMVRQ